jgi:hypothetical protein
MREAIRSWRRETNDGGCVCDGGKKCLGWGREKWLGSRREITLSKTDNNVKHFLVIEKELEEKHIPYDSNKNTKTMAMMMMLR